MNRLKEYFENTDHRIIDKWLHYFDIYDRHLSCYRGGKVIVLEIGISHGGSLQMWKDYFGEDSIIFGVDINQECKKFEEPGINVIIGSQSDRTFLRELVKQIPRPDIILDDGGHMMNQQIISFEELFDHVKDDGIYMCEDLHTSYWISHGGGFRRRGTFIEFSKKLIDKINAWHSHQGNFNIDKYTKSIFGLHFYNSILVIEKKEIQKPVSMRKGHPSIKEDIDWNKKRSLLEFISDYTDTALAKAGLPKWFREH